jgi:hypothetical protein
MCLYDIFKIDFKVHSFQGRKNTRPQEGLGNSKYANTYKPIADLGL